MESINVHLDKMESVLTKMDDTLEAARPSALTKKVSIDKNELFELIDDLRAVIDDAKRDLPNEIVQAKRLMSDTEKITTEARNKAAVIISNAEAEVVKMTSEHEITKLAQAKSMEMIEEAKQNAKEYRMKSKEYADETLSEVENTLRESLQLFSQNVRDVEEYFAETIDEIYENRQQLRGTPGKQQRQQPPQQ